MRALSERLSKRSGVLSALTSAIVAAALFSGCGFPDYTYTDDAGSGGEQGGSGGGGDDDGSAGGDTGASGSHNDASDVRDVSVEDAVTDRRDGYAEADAKDTSIPDTVGDPDVHAPDTAPECPGSAEDCLNGIDDDCDGMTDCQDSECQSGFRCVASIPSGWTGFVQLYDGAKSGVPNCTSSYPNLEITGGRDPVFDPASCSGCSCGQAMGIQCGDPTVLVYQNTTCDSEFGWQFADELHPHGTCLPKGLSFDPDGGTQGPPAAVRVMTPALPVAGTGSCQASGGIMSRTDPQWSYTAAACRADSSGTGCTGSKVCAPTADTSFNMGMCVYKAGVQVTCPPGQYSVKHVYYQDFDDKRTCSPCGCDAPSGAVCHGTVTVSSTATCSGAGIEATLSDMACKTVSNTTQKYMMYKDEPVTDAVCTPSGGQAGGTVAPLDATAYTFCCSAI